MLYQGLPVRGLAMTQRRSRCATTLASLHDKRQISCLDITRCVLADNTILSIAVRTASADVPRSFGIYGLSFHTGWGRSHPGGSLSVHYRRLLAYTVRSCPNDVHLRRRGSGV